MTWALRVWEGKDPDRRTQLSDDELSMRLELESSLAQLGRELLGDGSSEESLERWRRLLDLVGTHGSDDLAALIDDAWRVGTS